MSNKHWVVDSAACPHMTNDVHDLIDARYDINETVLLGDMHTLRATAVGTVRLKVATSDGRDTTLTLERTLYVPDLSFKLLSVRTLTNESSDYALTFDAGTATIKHTTTGVRIPCIDANPFYCIEDRAVTPETMHRALVAATPTSIASRSMSTSVNESLIHKRCAHFSLARIAATLRHSPIFKDERLLKMARAHKHDNNASCTACVRGKMKNASHPRSSSRASAPLELTHADLGTFSLTPSLQRNKYFLLLVDDHTKYITVCGLPDKSSAGVKRAVEQYMIRNERRLSGKNYKMIALRTDGGGEFEGELTTWMVNNGIIHQTSPRYEHSANGGVERYVLTVKDGARTLMIAANMPEEFWEYALLVIVYIHNRLLSSSATGPGNVTPREAFTGMKPCGDHWRTFGCKALVHVPTEIRKSIEPKAIECAFVGYDEEDEHGHLFYEPQSQRVFKAYGAQFDENSYFFASPNSVHESTHMTRPANASLQTQFAHFEPTHTAPNAHVYVDSNDDVDDDFLASVGVDECDTVSNMDNATVGVHETQQQHVANAQPAQMDEKRDIATVIVENNVTPPSSLTQLRVLGPSHTPISANTRAQTQLRVPVPTHTPISANTRAQKPLHASTYVSPRTKSPARAGAPPSSLAKLRVHAASSTRAPHIKTHPSKPLNVKSNGNNTSSRTNNVKSNANETGMINTHGASQADVTAAPIIADVSTEENKSVALATTQTVITDYTGLKIPAKTPRNYKEAMALPDRAKWEEAMQKETDAIHARDTWQYVQKSKEMLAHLLHSTWVFKYKPDMNGCVDRYKARLVVRGDRQVEGVDYRETFAPVAAIASIRMLLSIAAMQNMEVHQMDVTNAFLYAPLKELVHMHQPQGFDDPTFPREQYALKLKRSLYGLKQAPRAWYEHIDQTLEGMHFECLDQDQGIFMWSDDKIKCILSLYVDDLVIACNDLAWLTQFKARIKEKYDMVDLGEVRHLLGMNIERDRVKRQFYLSQPNHINKLLEQMNMLDCNTQASPMDAGTRLQKDMRPCPDGEELPPYVPDAEFMQRYQKALGSLNFIATYTRPDISFAVSTLGQFNKAPQKEHWSALKRVIRYLKGTTHHRLTLGGKLGNDADNPLRIRGYSDADYANDCDKRRSITGYVFYIGDGPVSWGSARQKTVALSTCEAEYMALAQATQEAVALGNMLTSLGYLQHGTAVPLHCDNQAAVHVAHNNKSTGALKHVDVKFHFVRQMIKRHRIVVSHVPAALQLADVLTKPLNRVKHELNTQHLSLTPTQIV